MSCLKTKKGQGFTNLNILLSCICVCGVLCFLIYACTHSLEKYNLSSCSTINNYFVTQIISVLFCSMFTPSIKFLCCQMNGTEIILWREDTKHHTTRLIVWATYLWAIGIGKEKKSKPFHKNHSYLVIRMAVSWCEWWLSSRWFWLCCHMQKFFKLACALKEIVGPSYRRTKTDDNIWIRLRFNCNKLLKYILKAYTSTQRTLTSSFFMMTNFTITMLIRFPMLGSL